MKKLLKKNTFKALGGLSMASIFVQSISFFSTFYLARIYAPENYGSFSSFLSWISILGIVSTLHFEYAIVLAKTKIESRTIFQTIFSLVMAFSAVLFIFCLITQQINLIIYPIGIILFSCNQIFEYYFIKNNQFKWLVIGRFISISTFIFQYLFGILKIENGLTIGYLLSAFAQFLCHFYIIEKDYFRFNFKIKIIYENYKVLFNYGLPSTLISVLSYNSIPILILTYFSGFETGIYFMAAKLLGAGILFISSTFSKIFHIKAAELYNDSNFKTLLSYYLYNFKIITIITFFLCIIIYLISVFGLKYINPLWSNVPIYVLILIPYFGIRMVYNPFSYLVEILRINKLELFFNIFQLFCTILGIWIGYLTSNLKIGLISISITNSLIISLFLYYFFYKIKKLSNLEIIKTTGNENN